MGNVLTATQLVEDTSIASRAMKAIFHRGVGAARRTRDRDAEDLVKKQYGDEGQIVSRRLFTDKTGPIYRRNLLAGEMYAYHMKSTLPHGDDGSRLLPNAMYLEYTMKMGDFETRLKLLDTEIIRDYDVLVKQDIALRVAALMRQGKAVVATEADYPPVWVMAEYLYAEWRLEPISTARDFRYDVDPFVVAKVDKYLKDVESKATLAVFEQMAEPMRKFVDKLAVPIGEDGSVFRDSLVENLNELSYLKKLNVNHDPRVDEMLAGIEAVIKPYLFSPDVLREQPEVRDAARERMAELVKRLDGYGFK